MKEKAKTFNFYLLQRTKRFRFHFCNYINYQTQVYVKKMLVKGLPKY